jgi:MFS family permease
MASNGLFSRWHSLPGYVAEPPLQPALNLTDPGLRPQTWDAFDFFTVSLTVSDLAKEFDKSATDITWGITLVLMFRSVGSILFGAASDRYGRRWPFIVNNLLFIVLELVSTHAHSLPKSLYSMYMYSQSACAPRLQAAKGWWCQA